MAQSQSHTNRERQLVVAYVWRVLIWIASTDNLNQIDCPYEAFACVDLVRPHTHTPTKHTINCAAAVVL